MPPRLSTPRRSRRSPLLPPALLLAMLLAGCAPDDDDPEVKTVNGTIRGLVVDSGGAPLADATVSFQEPGDGSLRTATSGSDGRFELDDVRLLELSAEQLDDDSDDDDQDNDQDGPIMLSIEPADADARLSAQLAVAPLAQVVDDAQQQQSVFIDAFDVYTGAVPLPALATAVSGRLRNTTDGTVIPGQALSLSFVRVEPPNAATAPAPGVTIQYDDRSDRATSTDAGGSFALDGVATGACYRLDVPGYDVGPATGDSPTCVAPIPNRDTAALYFATPAQTPQLQLGDVLASVESD